MPSPERSNVFNHLPLFDVKALDVDFLHQITPLPTPLQRFAQAAYLYLPRGTCNGALLLRKLGGTILGNAEVVNSTREPNFTLFHEFPDAGIRSKS